MFKKLYKNIILIILIIFLLFIANTEKAKAGCDWWCLICVFKQHIVCPEGVTCCPDGKVYFCSIPWVDDPGKCDASCSFTECGPPTTCYTCDFNCNCSSSGCFTPETQISTPSGEKQIKDLQQGDEVVSFDEQTGEQETSVVEKIYEVTRSAYYKLVTEDGKEVKVTGEHPLYVMPQDQSTDAKAMVDKGNLSFWEYLKTESLIRKVFDKSTSIFSK